MPSFAAEAKLAQPSSAVDAGKKLKAGPALVPNSEQKCLFPLTTVGLWYKRWAYFVGSHSSESARVGGSQSERRMIIRRSRIQSFTYRIVELP